MCRKSVCGLTARVLSPRGTKIHSCHTRFYLPIVSHPVAAQMPNWFLCVLTVERTARSVHHRCHPDLQLPLYDGLALHHRTHWLHWYRVRDRAHAADRQVRRSDKISTWIFWKWAIEINWKTWMLFYFSRLLMEELVNFMERVPKPQSATCWKNKELQR